MRLFYSAFLVVASACLLTCVKIPEGPFDSLVNEEVIEPMAYFDSASFTDQSAITFKVALPEDLKNKVASYKWEIFTELKELVASSEDWEFTGMKFPVDDYIAVFTLKASDEEGGESRAFIKRFFVNPIAVSTDFILTGIDPNDDSGVANDDYITNVNNNITILGTTTTPNTEVKISVRCTELNYENDETFVTSDESGIINFEFIDSVGLADGAYEIVILDKSDSTKGSETLILVIDTTAPSITWKKEGDDSEVAYGGNVALHSQVKSPEGLVDKVYTSVNFSPAEGTQGFDAFIVGKQELKFSAKDIAGNPSSEIQKKLTILAPEDPVIVNGKFEDSVGVSVEHSSTETGGEATGWVLSMNVRAGEGLRLSSTDYSAEGSGPFSELSNVDLAKFYFCCVHSGGNEGNSLWLGGEKKCGNDSPGLYDQWYCQTWGSAKLLAVKVFKGVTYQFSIETKSGKNEEADCKKITADPTAKFGIEPSLGMQLSNDGGTSFQAEPLFKDISVNDSWQLQSFNFVADTSGPINVVLEKYENVDKVAGGWCEFDNVSLTVQDYPKVN